MGFMDLFKKKTNKDSKINDNLQNEDNSNNDLNLNLESIADNSNKKIEKSMNFKYLNKLIQSGEKEIILEYDIILNSVDEFFYQNGINIDVDNIIINGNGHFIDAKNKNRFFNIRGNNISFKNINFKNGFSKNEGGAFLITDINNKIKIDNCTFINCCSIYGGAIFSNSNVEIVNSTFENCTTLRGIKFKTPGSGYGGAIDIGENSFLKLDNCIFNNCKADDSGVACILGVAEIENCEFNNCNSSFRGGCFSLNYDSKLDINNCRFINISCNMDGGVIDNLGDAKIRNSKFHKCSATERGGSIYNGGGSIYIENCKFSKNTSKIGGSIYNKSFLKVYNSNFYDNINDSNIIFNTNSLSCVESIFQDNNTISIFYNDSGSELSILNSKFIKNVLNKYSICNFGESYVIETLFKNNISNNSKNCADIYNNNFLSLKKPKYVECNHKSIFNMGHLEIRNMDEIQISEKIENMGSLVNLFDVENKNTNNFTLLNDLIQSNEKYITLDEDFILERFEMDFFEGGIELNRDNVVIDGNGHCIDAQNASRIFLVTSEKVKLKNIIFKNSKLINKFDKKVNGGGVIRIVNSASLTLENCKFLNNKSNDLGGAILNNGELISNNSLFKNNSCDYYGGSIFNNGHLSSIKDNFINNCSKLGSAIFNEGILDLISIKTSKNNSSLISKDIFNNGIIFDTDILTLENSIYNIGQFNPILNNDFISFSDFNELINNKDEIVLNGDVIYNFKTDDNFKSGIIIDTNSEVPLIIEGNNHIFDAKNVASFLKIKSKSNVIFRNLHFINGFSKNNSLIINEGIVSFEKCKFDNNCSISCIESNNDLKLTNSIFSNNFSVKYLLRGGFEIKESIFFNNDSVNFLIETLFDLNIKDSYYLCNSSKSLIFNNKQNMSINNSEFIHNCSEKFGSIILNEGNLELSSSNFLRNSSFIGGAIYNSGYLEIIDCYFTHNNAKDGGGVIYNIFHSNLRIKDCIFKNNFVKQGDGGAIYNLEHMYLESCIFENNSANCGGAIMNVGDIELNSCIFEDNFSKLCGNIFNAINCNLNYYNCIFNNNSPDNIFNNVEK